MNSDADRQGPIPGKWDCVVVGGGAAGLSAALVLGRARRRTLLLDAGEQSNRAAAGIGGLLGSDGRPPADLYAAGRAELAAYPSVEVRAGESAVGASPQAGGFALELGDGSRVEARTVLLAPGMEYRPPQIPGLREHWGSTVFHCPFCHGWEVRGRRLGVLGAGAAQKAVLLRAWSERVTLLTDGEEGPARRSGRCSARPGSRSSRARSSGCAATTEPSPRSPSTTARSSPSTPCSSTPRCTSARSWWPSSESSSPRLR